MSMMNTLITSSSGLNVVALDEDDNKKVNEELQRVDLFIVPLSPYSFVC
jgi:hypothetical protein